jgi:O-antigen/teichoic acid export membrane protein
MKNSFLRNVSHSILAQIVSLVTGFTISLIVPKFISEIDYSYWQTYLLFATYIGIFHFGIFDGMYLRYGQYDNNELDKNTYIIQLNFLFFNNFVIGIILILS